MKLLALAISSLSAVVQARVKFMGVAISGIDFGCNIDGSCDLASAQLPLASQGGADGLGQMRHFVQDDGMNIFRLPTSWQYLTNNNNNGKLDAGKAREYDKLVQACLSTGAHCMIDMHNYARVDGQVIGQGGPSNEAFVQLWTALARKYAGEPRVVFEIMNEPHSLDVAAWAATCQQVVTGIREAGATTQLILLPGSNFDSAATLEASGGAAALLAITNPDGGHAGLVLDVHQYLDADNSGKHANCVTDNVASFAAVAVFLRAHQRTALVGETGASHDTSCMARFCAQNDFLNQNADVFLGYVAWGAGGFDPSYVLSLTPIRKAGAYVDNDLLAQCVVGPYRHGSSSGDDSNDSPLSPSSNRHPQPGRQSTPVLLPSTSTASTTAQIGTSTMTLSTSAIPQPNQLITAPGGKPIVSSAEPPSTAATSEARPGTLDPSVLKSNHCSQSVPNARFALALAMAVAIST